MSWTSLYWWHQAQQRLGTENTGWIETNCGNKCCLNVADSFGTCRGKRRKLQEGSRSNTPAGDGCSRKHMGFLWSHRLLIGSLWHLQQVILTHSASVSLPRKGRIKSWASQDMDSQLMDLKQELASFFCKGPGNKCSQLCGPYSLCHSFSTAFAVAIGNAYLQKQAAGWLAHGPWFADTKCLAKAEHTQSCVWLSWAQGTFAFVGLLHHNRNFFFFNANFFSYDFFF